MKTKEMSKESIVRKESRELDGNLYEYTLSVKISNKVASYRLPLYSVRVEMTDALGRRSSSSLDDVFYDSQRAFSFFNRAVENFATPIDLPYIFEDEVVR